MQAASNPYQKSTFTNALTYGKTELNGRRKYLFNFNGQERDDEVYGAGNAYSFEYRVHDPRLGRFLRVDPLYRDYPWNSTYAFAENDVIANIDLEGLEKQRPDVLGEGGEIKQTANDNARVDNVAMLEKGIITKSSGTYNKSPIVDIRFKTGVGGGLNLSLGNRHVGGELNVISIEQSLITYEQDVSQGASVGVGLFSIGTSWEMQNKEFKGEAIIVTEGDGWNQLKREIANYPDAFTIRKVEVSTEMTFAFVNFNLTKELVYKIKGENKRLIREKNNSNSEISAGKFTAKLWLFLGINVSVDLFRFLESLNSSGASP